MTSYDLILQSIVDAINTIPELAGRAVLDRSEKLTADAMPAATVSPGSLAEEEAYDDCSRERFEVKVDLFVAGPKPSSKFFPLSGKIGAALKSSEDLCNLIAGFGLRTVDEPVYGDYDGFAGYVTIRFQFLLLST